MCAHRAYSEAAGRYSCRRGLLHFAFGLLLLISVNACANLFGGSAKEARYDRQQQKLIEDALPTHRSWTPDKIILGIEVFDYIIVAHSIESDLGGISRLRISPKPSSDGENVYVRIQPEPQEQLEFYYLAKLPNLRNGRTTITARKIKEPIDIPELPPPLDQITITLIIQDNTVISNRIDNYSQQTFAMYFEGVRSYTHKTK